MVLEDGGVLKPPANALPCLKSLFVDPQREDKSLLSIWNECEASGHGVVAVFNLYGSAWSQARRTYAPVRTPSGALSGVRVNGDSEGAEGDDSDAVEGGVRPSDCHRLLQDYRAAAAAEEERGGGGLNGADVESRYAVHFHFGDRLFVGGLHDEHVVSVARGRSEIAAISKVLTFESPTPDGGDVSGGGGSSGFGKGEWASIGLPDMFNAGGAIVSEDMWQEGGRAEADLMVKGSGRFLALCSLPPSAVLFDGKPLEFRHDRTSEGVPFLEAELPGGYEGTPRQLVVQWGKDSRAGGGGGGGGSS